MSAWVYILECSDRTLYTGSTTNLSQRIPQHENGVFEGYTSRRRPVRFRWSQEFASVVEAIEAERQIKGWSRAKKEALIAGDFDLLHQLAQSREMVARREKRQSSTPRNEKAQRLRSD